MYNEISQIASQENRLYFNQCSSKHSIIFGAISIIFAIGGIIALVGGLTGFPFLPMSFEATIIGGVLLGLSATLALCILISRIWDSRKSNNQDRNNENALPMHSPRDGQVVTSTAFRPVTPEPEVSSLPSSRPMTPDPQASLLSSSHPATQDPQVSSLPSSRPATPDPQVSSLPSSRPATPDPEVSSLPSSRPATPEPEVSSLPSSRPMTPDPQVSSLPSSRPATPDPQVSSLPSSRPMTPDLADCHHFSSPSLPIQPVEDSRNKQTYLWMENSDCIEIRVLKEDIEENPLWHLEELSKVIDANKEKRCSKRSTVVFLNKDGTDRPGGDFMGVTRAYLEILFSSIIKCSKMNFEERNRLLYPVIRNERQLEIYEMMGKVIIYFYPSYSIGVYFDPSLFAALFQIPPQDILNQFEEIPLDTKLSVAESIVDSLKSRGIHSPYADLVQFLKKKDDEWDLNEVEKAVNFANLYIDDQPSFTTQGDKEELKQFLEDRFKDVFYPELQAIHRLAKGIYSYFNGKWDAFKDCDYLEFSTQLQGIFSKEQVAHSILVEDNESIPFKMQRKVNWLRKWIVDEATEEEVKKLLIFVTGSSSLSPGTKIIVIQQRVVEDEKLRDRNGYTPFPIVHTCDLQIEIAPTDSGTGEGFNDFTESAFIGCIKALLDENTFSIE